MSLIKPKEKNEKEQFRISIEKAILEKVKKYCEWAGVKKYDDFFEQSAEIVFKKDKKWAKYLKQKPTNNS